MPQHSDHDQYSNMGHSRQWSANPPIRTVKPSDAYPKVKVTHTTYPSTVTLGGVTRIVDASLMKQRESEPVEDAMRGNTLTGNKRYAEFTLNGGPLDGQKASVQIKGTTGQYVDYTTMVGGTIIRYTCPSEEDYEDRQLFFDAYSTLLGIAKFTSAVEKQGGVKNLSKIAKVKEDKFLDAVEAIIHPVVDPKVMQNLYRNEYEIREAKEEDRFREALRGVSTKPNRSNIQ